MTATSDELEPKNFYEAIEYFGISEAEVKAGIEQFESFTQKLDREEERYMFSNNIGSNFAKCAVQVYMGNKPATSADEDESREIALKMAQTNPDDLYMSDTMLFNRKSALRTIQENREDIFSDAPSDLNDENLEKYLDSITTSVEGFSPIHIKQVGLLLGYAKDSAIQYADHIEESSKITTKIITESTDSVLKQAIQKASNHDKNRVETVGTYKEENTAEILKALEDPMFMDISQEAKEYFVNTRPLTAPGFNFEATKEDYPEYKQHIMTLWKASKLEEYFEKKQIDAEIIDPESVEDIEYFVQEVADSSYTLVEDIIDPEKRSMQRMMRKAQGESERPEENLQTGLARYFEISKQLKPDKEESFSLVENDVLSSLIELTSSVEQGMKTPDSVQALPEFRRLVRAYYYSERLIGALKGSTEDDNEKEFYEQLFQKHLGPISEEEQNRTSPNTIFQNICADAYMHIYQKNKA